MRPDAYEPLAEQYSLSCKGFNDVTKQFEQTEKDISLN
jgi:hypothetical protein